MINQNHQLYLPFIFQNNSPPDTFCLFVRMSLSLLHL